MYRITSTRRIYIELNNKCNLNCRFCPYHYIKTEKQELSLECVKHILDDINENIDYRIVYFHNVNEPLLYPYINDLVTYCDEKNIRFGLTTNGLLLNKHITELAKSNIHTLNISYQISNPLEHGFRGMTLTLNEYRESIINSVSMLLTSGFKGKIKIKLLITDDNSYYNGSLITGITTIDDFVSEVEKIYFQLNKTRLEDEKKNILKKIQLNRHCKIEILKQVYVETFPFLNWGNYFENPYKAYVGRCDGIAGQLLIRSNGDVCPCCYDLNSDICLGNIYRQQLSEILKNKKTQIIKNNINSKLLCYSRCRRCFGQKTLNSLLKEQINVLKKSEIAEQFQMSNNNIRLY